MGKALSYIAYIATSDKTYYEQYSLAVIGFHCTFNCKIKKTY